MLREMTVADWVGWQAFDQVNPIGVQHLETLLALLVTGYYQVHSKSHYTVSDFYPPWKREAEFEELTPEEEIARFDAMTRGWGKKSQSED